MVGARQNSFPAENQVLRKLLDEALLKLASMSALLREQESVAVEGIKLEHDTLPALVRPAEVERPFGNDEKLENEVLYASLAKTQFRIFRMAEELKLAERRNRGLGVVDGVDRLSRFMRAWRNIVTLFYEILCLLGPNAGLIRRANQARADRDFTSAAQLYAQICKAMPGHFRLWVQQGNMAKDAGLFYQARQAYEAARRLHGDDADLHLQLGHLCKLTGDTVGAAHAYCVSLSCQPDHADAYRELVAIGYVDVADRIRANARL